MLLSMQTATLADESRPRGDAAGLASGKLEIQALNRVTDLRGVIDQVECGGVQRIRDEYGPRRGRAPHPVWSTIKGTINRHERVYHQLVDPGEFAGNKERFFAFFADPRRQKRKADEGSNLIPYRLVAEAIPPRDKDIRQEKEGAKYRDEAGLFSVQRWKQQWGEANDWEIWRALEKERYTRR